MNVVVEHVPARRTPLRRLGRGAAGWLAPLATFVALLVAWHAATRVFDWPIWLVPSPLDVADATWEYRSLLPRQFWVTLLESLAGFGLAAAVGIPLAVLIAASRFLVSFLLCVFPIVISTATGLRSTPPELVELTRSLCASQAQVFRKARFPAALPHVFVGLKVAISLAVIGAVIGEFVGASEGLGWVIVNSGANVNTSLAFSAMVLLSLMSVALFYALVALERLLVPWARHEEG